MLDGALRGLLDAGPVLVPAGAPLRWEDEITIRTWHRGGKSAIMYRDYDLFVNGQPVGEAVSLGAGQRGPYRLLRLGALPSPSWTGTGGGSCARPNPLQAAPARRRRMEPADRRRMHYSDTDINGHVNNTRYADFACDAVEMEDLEPGPVPVPSCRSAIWPSAAPGMSWTCRWPARGASHYVHGWTNTANPALRRP